MHMMCTPEQSLTLLCSGPSLTRSRPSLLPAIVDSSWILSEPRLDRYIDADRYLTGWSPRRYQWSYELHCSFSFIPISRHPLIIQLSRGWSFEIWTKQVNPQSEWASPSMSQCRSIYWRGIMTNRCRRPEYDCLVGQNSVLCWCTNHE